MTTTVSTKRCCRCRRRKPAKSFHRNRAQRDGLATHCKTCRKGIVTPEQIRRVGLKHKYGITPEQYDEMLRRQGGRCAICRKRPNGRRLAVDHCHETNRVRGLLCAICNRVVAALEHVGTDKYADYIEGTK